MASSDSGECCVCGKVTQDRCGACAEADFDLFFCSREHQKLIWPAHKLVCGPLAVPFRWPDLSQAEMQDALLHKDAVVRLNESADGRGELSLRSMLKSSNIGSFLTVEAFIAWLGHNDKNDLGRSASQSCLLYVRQWTYHRVMRDAAPPSPAALATLSPFNLCASISFNMKMELHPSAPWWSSLHHRILAFAAVNYVSLRRGDGSYGLLLLATAKRVLDCLKTEVAAHDPEVAAHAIGVMARLVPVSPR
ncbi:hypothetical protein JCM10213_003176 [Rhodosporidiobolus nylandii]